MSPIESTKPVRTIAGHVRITHQSLDEYKLNVRDICRAYDVPPWLVENGWPRPRFPRVRWALRRWWPL